MAPLLIALLPFALLPAVLGLSGHPAAAGFALFALAAALLAAAAQLAIGLTRLPLLWLGGVAATAAAAMPLLVFDLGFQPGMALALTPILGLLVGALLWHLTGRLPALPAAAVSLPALLGLVALPAITAESDRNLPLPALDAGLALAVLVLLLLLVLTGRFLASPLLRLAEAAWAAGLPAGRIGLDRRATGLVAGLLGSALAAAAGALLALGPTPVMTAEAADWAVLGIALLAVGRLGGNRLGAALLAALPLLLLPKLTIVLQPAFLDPTLPAALAALALHLVIRPDGRPAWQPPAAVEPGARLSPARLAQR